MKTNRVVIGITVAGSVVIYGVAEAAGLLDWKMGTRRCTQVADGLIKTWLSCIMGASLFPKGAPT
jgi:hypothetical protein